MGESKSMSNDSLVHIFSNEETTDDEKLKMVVELFEEHIAQIGLVADVGNKCGRSDLVERAWIMVTK